jgi:hypothetical protein
MYERIKVNYHDTKYNHKTLLQASYNHQVQGLLTMTRHFIMTMLLDSVNRLNFRKLATFPSPAEQRTFSDRSLEGSVYSFRIALLRDPEDYVLCSSDDRNTASFLNTEVLKK